MAPPRIPGAVITANCPVCGKEYTYKRSWPRKHCSDACYQSTRKHPVTQICPVCGKEFECLESWPRTYCSHHCAGTTYVDRLPKGRPETTRYTATCEMCNQSYECEPASTRGRFCSLRCWGDWQKTQPGKNIGKKFGRAKQLPPPTMLTCPICSKTFVVKPGHAKKRKCCSLACMGKYRSLHFTGENSNGWLGGYEPYYGPSWRKARHDVRQRDHTCADCGKSKEELGRHLDVHHIIPFRRFGPLHHREANDLSNLVSLCNTCHTTREWRDNR